ncbi:MAG: T9SS type A sorting domain-containing protein [Bacteroidales bacterium]|nr:T9SS type A sorting domain-containing protein [Bacteroidales bacterium]
MKTNKMLKLFFFMNVVLFSDILCSQVSETISNQWTATDGLGRKLPDITQTGDARGGKYIGLFYWTWHCDDIATPEVMDISQILLNDPTAATNSSNTLWKGIEGGVFWWDQPLFGYYRTTDDWVLRKHAEMLADAGVDVVFFDCTNGSFTWKSSYMELLKVWEQARQDGVNTPKIGFILPFGATSDEVTSINELYTDLYEPQLYKDLWFMWHDKPLIMAYPELSVQRGHNASLKFTATSSFSAISACCPSYSNNIGSLTFSLYKWNTSYTQSVAGTPVAVDTIVNFEDNAYITLTFPTQPAGDYIWDLSNGTETVGVWKWMNGTNSAVSYYAGLRVSGYYDSRISYGSSINNFTSLTTGTEHTPVQVAENGINLARINVIKNFFTFRPGQPDYACGPKRKDQWGWLEIAPQKGYAPKTDGGYEEVTVGVGQNACDYTGGSCCAFNMYEFKSGPAYETYGRSYTQANKQDTSAGAYLKGLNFQEQWERAHVLDPDLVFVTGWNEWVAGRWSNWGIPMGFVDQYNADKSRDIEPVKSWGNKGDVYYMQLISNIRRFKGMDLPEAVSAQKNINMQDITSWEGVKPEYKSYKGNVLHRNAAGQGSLVYTNTTGRNDIVRAKVARDPSYIYFYVETAESLTDKANANWMRLFIDVDRDKTTGWEGYDYVVNRVNPEDSATVEKSTDSWYWQKAGSAAYSMNGKTLVIKIKRTLLGIAESAPINFEFKWSDNMQEDGNIMDFYVNGDVAPGGRFNYVYNETFISTLKEVNRLSINVSPNPSTNDFLIQAPTLISSIVVYDLLGNVVDRIKLDANASQLRFGSNLRLGTYLVTVAGKDGFRQRVKIIKL